MHGSEYMKGKKCMQAVQYHISDNIAMYNTINVQVMRSASARAAVESGSRRSMISTTIGYREGIHRTDIQRRI